MHDPQEQHVVPKLLSAAKSLEMAMPFLSAVSSPYLLIHMSHMHSDTVICEGAREKGPIGFHYRN